MLTLPAGVLRSGVSSREMTRRSGIPDMYGSPGVKPMNST